MKYTIVNSAGIPDFPSRRIGTQNYAVLPYQYTRKSVADKPKNAKKPITRASFWLTDHRLCVYASDCLMSDFSGLSDLPIAAHQRGHFLNALQRERRLAKELHGDAHQFHGVIIRCHAVGAERTASLAAVYDGPFPAPAYPNGDRLHDAAAVACPIAGFYVHMKAA